MVAGSFQFNKIFSNSSGIIPSESELTSFFSYKKPIILQLIGLKYARTPEY